MLDACQQSQCNAPCLRDHHLLSCFAVAQQGFLCEGALTNASSMQLQDNTMLPGETCKELCSLCTMLRCAVLHCMALPSTVQHRLAPPRPALPCHALSNDLQMGPMPDPHLEGGTLEVPRSSCSPHQSHHRASPAGASRPALLWSACAPLPPLLPSSLAT